MSHLSFHYSSMNAGKTAALLQTAYNYEQAGKAVLALTAAVDDRAGVGVIQTRFGNASRPAMVFDQNTAFTIESIGGAQCLFIDEAQFLQPEQVRQLHQLATLHDIPVQCFGLRTDFQGNPFPGAAMLLALADRLEEYRQSVCGCGKLASMNMRFDEQGRRIQQGPQVLIGGNGRYQQGCPACFYTEH